MLFVSIFLIIWLQASPVGLGSSDFYWLLFSLLIGWSSAVLMMALFVYDYRWGQLPNRWTLMLATIALLATIAALALRQPLLWQPGAPQATLDTIWLTLLSGFGAGLFFLAVIVGSELILKKPGMGLGDAKLAVGLGLLLGFPGIIVGLYLAFVFGSVLSLLLIAGKRKKLGNSIPFGPFMIGGALIAMWLTSPIANWYTNLLF